MLVVIVRGLLIDSSRHFLPVSTMYDMIDAMAAVKINVLHWHLVDAIAFPIKSNKYPDFIKGAYAPDAAYSTSDVSITAACVMIRWSQ